MKSIAYVQMIGDFLHYGHVKLLQTAKEYTGYVVVGLLTDRAANEQRGQTIENYSERESVLKQLKCVDEVMMQDEQSPENNIKEVLKLTPNFKIYLFHGDDWKVIPGSDYVKSIGGEVVTLPYYKRLDKNKIEIKYKGNAKPIISTKAQTLKNLKRKLKKSYIEDFVIFKVDIWQYDPTWVLDIINRDIGFEKIVVRSSALNEDAYDESKAGHYKSILNVSANDTKEMVDAINEVIESYDSNPKNEILVQRQTKNITMSGVVFTRKIENNAPYYVINYDKTGSTDSVTSGKENSKTEIIRNIRKKECPKQWWKLIEAIREIESLIPSIPLDIEFAITKKKIVIFQVRPLAANKVLSNETDFDVFLLIDKLGESFQEGNAYSDMAFWNPAEMIGTLPNRLDYSLYKYIITDGHWNYALSTMGYNDVEPDNLMTEFGGKPYIDLNQTFNGLLTDKLPKEIKEKLVKYYHKKLRNHPELHDKVEFEIIHNCVYPGFDEDIKELYKAGFSKYEVKTVSETVGIHTRLIMESQHWFLEAKESLQHLKESRKNILKFIDYDSLDSINDGIYKLLTYCIQLGTVDFSRMARMAFIGNIWLKALVKQGKITQDFYDDYLKSISVVKLGGHLRPGTYDITSQRYDKNPNIKLTKIEKKKKQIKVPDVYDFKESEYFIRKSIEMREKVKFEFTKNLSDALELIAELGEKLGFTREEMAQLDIKTILTSKGRTKKDIKEAWSAIIDLRKKQKTIYEKLSLPPILFSKQDFKVIPTYVSKPNFITQKSVESKITHVNYFSSSPTRNIVTLRNADPGYDWIFGKDIKGLVTCYGGVASHMAIRCAEFGIPAAIGCGPEIYNKIIKGEKVKIDCKKQKIFVDDKKVV